MRLNQRGVLLAAPTGPPPEEREARNECQRKDERKRNEQPLRRMCMSACRYRTQTAGEGFAGGSRCGGCCGRCMERGVSALSSIRYPV